jgi:hypothetical protein
MARSWSSSETSDAPAQSTRTQRATTATRAAIEEWQQLSIDDAADAGGGEQLAEAVTLLGLR